MKCRFALLAGCSLLLAGCLNEPIGVRDAGFGEAAKFNAAVQTINPDPVNAPGAAQPGDNGEHGVKAVERYSKGEVKEVQTMQTTTGTSGSSGGPH